MNREDYYISQMKSRYIGDDGAVVGDMIYSMDSFCENIHFKREWLSLYQIAQKSMIVNISDAIAMNAKPKFALISISLPKNITTKEIDELTSGFKDIANRYNCEIIGGDTVAGDKIDISITIISQSDNPLFRKGLKVGDILAYTGELGESKRDLNRLFNNQKIESNSKFIKPTLRDDFIYSMREYIKVGMDISDGLFCDTNKLLQINNLGAKLTQDIEEDIYSSGEEYEMLIGFEPSKLEILQSYGLKLTPFATIIEDKNLLYCKNHHF